MQPTYGADTMLVRHLLHVHYIAKISDLVKLTKNELKLTEKNCEN